MQPSEEIKSRLDIIDVIRDYIQLKPAGVNFRANCPFHREKTPSFMVNPEKQIYHCFGCGKGGDIFSFVMEMEGLNFVEALKVLAPKAGVELKREDPVVASERNRLLDIVDLSSRYYHKMLIDSPLAQGARSYLEKRGLKKETIEEWQIGFSPDSWDDLVNFLKGKGYKEQEIFASGMTVKKEGTNRFYNRFRGRIMFPIWNQNGQVIAFSARVSPEKEATEEMGKYINSPQSKIYDKSKVLFGLDKAKTAIRKEDAAVLVEGQMDVITAHEYGFKNVVAASGTALTPEQVLLLKRYSNNIVLAFDADAAGEKAMERGMDAAMRAEMNIKAMEIRQGKDPDEYIRSDQDGWRQAVAAARPALEIFFENKLSGLDLSQAEDKREAAKRILPVIFKLGNNIEKDFWLRKLGQKIDVKEEILREMVAKISPEKIYTPSTSPAGALAKKERPGREEMLSEVFLALLLRFPGLLETAANNIFPDQVAGAENRSLYTSLLFYYNNIIENWTKDGRGNTAPAVDYSAFRNFLVSAGANEESREEKQYLNSQLDHLNKLVVLGDRDFFEFDSDQARAEMFKVSLELKRFYLSSRRRELARLVAEMEERGEGEEANGLLEELKSLSEEASEL